MEAFDDILTQYRIGSVYEAWKTGMGGEEKGEGDILGN